MKKFWKYRLPKKKHPMVSVIIPCYGGADASRAITSVPDGCEIIVSDNGSTPAEARENGLNIAHGEWITFLDADDEFTCDFLQELKKLPPKVVWVIFRVQDEENNFLCPVDNVFLHGKFFRRKWWNEHNIHFPKVRTNEDVGIYVTVNGLLYMEEDGKEQMAVIDKEAYCYHSNPESMTRSNPNYNRDSIPDYLEAVCGTLLNRNEFDTEWRMMVMKKGIMQCHMVDDGSHEKDIVDMENKIETMVKNYGN